MISHISSDMFFGEENCPKRGVFEEMGQGVDSVPGLVGRTPDVRSTMTPKGCLRCAKGGR